MVLARVLFAFLSVVAIVYAVRSTDRKPLDRISTLIAGALAFHFTVFTVWRT